VPKSCASEAKGVEKEIEGLESEVQILQRGNSVSSFVEDMAPDITAAPKTKIQAALDDLKSPSSTSKGARPGLEALVEEAGGEGLGAQVKEFSAALSDMIETVNSDLRKDRIAMMTTQDVPELLDNTVAQMNKVNGVAASLRQKLASIAELANLELDRSAAIGKARLEVGPGAPVSDADEDAAAKSMEQLSRSSSSVPYEAREVEDAEAARKVYSEIDAFMHGKGPRKVRSEIEQAIRAVLKEENGDHVNTASQAGLAKDCNVTEEVGKSQESAKNVDAYRDVPMGARTSEVAGRLAHSSCGGESLASCGAENLLIPLSKLTNSQSPAVTLCQSRRPAKQIPCSSLHSAQRAATFLSSADARPYVKRGTSHKCFF
jgi:hypothetical protein